MNDTNIQATDKETTALDMACSDADKGCLDQMKQVWQQMWQDFLRTRICLTYQMKLELCRGTPRKSAREGQSAAPRAALPCGTTKNGQWSCSLLAAVTGTALTCALCTLLMTVKGCCLRK